MSWKVRLGVTGFVVFTALPIIEIALLIEMGKRIGTWWTVAFVIGTGILGGALLGVEGYGVFRKMREEIQATRIPKDSIIDGVLVIVGALLLISPGVLTDVTGILFMFPPTRYLVRSGVKHWISKYIFVNI
ncbi:MAG: FxsA family protein [Bacillota bacterium]